MGRGFVIPAIRRSRCSAGSAFAAFAALPALTPTRRSTPAPLPQGSHATAPAKPTQAALVGTLAWRPGKSIHLIPSTTAPRNAAPRAASRRGAVGGNKTLQAYRLRLHRSPTSES